MIIGASLSEPHTHYTAVQNPEYIYIYCRAVLYTIIIIINVTRTSLAPTVIITPHKYYTIIALVQILFTVLYMGVCVSTYI